MVYSVFLYPTNGGFDVDPIKRYLEAKPDVILDPLGTPTYIVCGVPEAVELCRDKRIEEPDRFPYSVLVTVQPDVINIFQEYGDKYDLRSARDFVRWVIEQQPCLVKDEYRVDWTERVEREGVGVLYPPWLDEKVLERAIRLAPSDPPLRDAWLLVLGALERARVSSDDLRDVLASLREGRDLIVEEVGFEHIAGKLRVSFLDQEADCSAADMIVQLDKLFNAGH